MKKLTVKLTYFKSYGKYHSGGEYEVFAHTPIYKIFEGARRLKDARRLPGLVEGHSNVHVLVEVPEHIHSYPCLLIGDT